MNTPQIIYNFLDKAQNINNKHRSISSFFVEAFNLNNISDHEINKLRIHLSNHVYKLSDVIEIDQPELDHSWANDVIKILNFPLSENIDLFTLDVNSLFPHVKNFIGSQIRLWNIIHGNQKNLDKDQMISIKQKSEALIEEFIVNNDLAPNVRAFLIKQLRKIIEAIDHYQIYGNEGLIEILDESIGHAFTNKNYEDFLKDAQSTIWKEYLLIISTVVTTSDSFVSLTNNIKNFLP
ncbi:MULTISPECIES: hypothetical protein [unclassified Acinetobacter]|uniref:hypothetical protein n=1 Tax=unclassified Acinetobacter TaxID=196816 RepID=UPI001C241CC9|nr:MULTISPECIES: hypothetical protein [unclassified Acinetobacter]